MNTFIILLITIFSWGVGPIFSKLSVNKIGPKAVFWHYLFYGALIITTSIIFFKFKHIIASNKEGVLLSLFAAFFSFFGAFGYFYILSKKDVSSSIFLINLFPAVSAILAFIFLKETITFSKIVGISFAIIALFFLYR